MSVVRTKGRAKVPLTTSRSDFIRDGSDLDFRETIYVMVQSVACLSICREAFGRTLELTATQFVVLMGVAYLAGESGATISTLANHISLAPTHTTTEVGRLVKRKLLVKTKSSADARSVLVTLSPLVEKAVARVAPLLRRINDLLFADISTNELRTIRKACAQLVVNAEEALVELGRSKGKVSAPSGSRTRTTKGTAAKAMAAGSA